MKFEVIRQKIVVDSTPNEAYFAYLDPKKHSEFTGSPATGSTKVKGGFTAWDGYITGRHLQLVEGKRVVQEWKTTEWPEGYPPSIVELSFTAKGNGTEIVMVHSKVPAEQAEDYAQGWKDWYWEPLKRYLSKKS